MSAGAAGWPSMPIAAGAVHEVTFSRIAVERGRSLDYLDGDVVRLHVVVRASLGAVVVNDRRNDQWGDELRLPLDAKDLAGPVRITLAWQADGVHVRLPDGSGLTFNRWTADGAPVMLRQPLGVGVHMADKPEAALPGSPPAPDPPTPQPPPPSPGTAAAVADLAPAPVPPQAPQPAPQQGAPPMPPAGTPELPALLRASLAPPPLAPADQASPLLAATAALLATPPAPPPAPAPVPPPAPAAAPVAPAPVAPAPAAGGIDRLPWLASVARGRRVAVFGALDTPGATLVRRALDAPAAAVTAIDDRALDDTAWDSLLDRLAPGAAAPEGLRLLGAALVDPYLPEQVGGHDLALCLDLLHRLPDPLGTLRALRQVAGRCVVSVPVAPAQLGGDAAGAAFGDDGLDMSELGALYIPGLGPRLHAMAAAQLRGDKDAVWLMTAAHAEHLARLAGFRIASSGPDIADPTGTHLMLLDVG